MAKVPDTNENAMKCVCPNCPTYDECAKKGTEILYCAKGKSKCELVDRGCICGSCPLWDEFSLSKGYFCFTGEAE